jgi:hypothetical protein
MVVTQDTIDRETILTRLMAPPCTDDTQPGCPGCVSVAKLRDLDQNEVAPYLRILHQASLSAESNKGETLGNQVQHITKMVGIRSADSLLELLAMYQLR